MSNTDDTTTLEELEAALGANIQGLFDYIEDLKQQLSRSITFSDADTRDDVKELILDDDGDLVVDDIRGYLQNYHQIERELEECKNRSAAPKMPTEPPSRVTGAVIAGKRQSDEKEKDDGSKKSALDRLLGK